MSEVKDLSIEAYRAFRKWEDEKYGDNTPLADMHVEMWMEAYMLGHANGVKSQYLPKEENQNEMA
jgi:hypothetical protein